MRLFLMRHASAEFNLIDDYQRPLSPEGKQEANQAIGFFKLQPDIDQVICSSAARTKQTLAIIEAQVNFTQSQFSEALYDIDAEKLLILIQQQRAANSLLIIGHNPTIYDIIIKLADKNSDNYQQFALSAVKPAQVTLLEFKAKNWQTIAENSAAITQIFIPS